MMKLFSTLSVSVVIICMAFLSLGCKTNEIIGFIGSNNDDQQLEIGSLSQIFPLQGKGTQGNPYSVSYYEQSSGGAIFFKSIIDTMTCDAPASHAIYLNEGGKRGFFLREVMLSGDVAEVVNFECSVTGMDVTKKVYFKFTVLPQKIVRMDRRHKDVAELKGISVEVGGAISADARYVVYASSQDNLAVGDSNSLADIYLVDRLTSISTLITKAFDGTSSDGASSVPDISADGRYVVFRSLASNLTVGDTNTSADIFRHDILTGETILVSKSTAGIVANGHSADPQISADGNYVVYTSAATNLVAGDTNSNTDIFLRNISAESTIMISWDSTGNSSNNDSSFPAISRDGTKILFQSAASDLVTGDSNGRTDIFLYDSTIVTPDPNISIVSKKADGTLGDNNSSRPSFSGDGSIAVFTTLATNLVPGDTNAGYDVLWKKLSTEEYRVVTSMTNGTITNYPLYQDGRTSANYDGSRVAFVAAGQSNLGTGTATANYPVVFIKDMTTGQLHSSIRDSNGNIPYSNVYNPAISDNGQYVYFQHDSGWYSSGIVNGDTAFGGAKPALFNFTTGQSEALIMPIYGLLSDSPTSYPRRGQFNSDISVATAFVWSEFLTPTGAPKKFPGIYQFNLNSSVTTLASRNTAGVVSTAWEQEYQVSGNGRYSFFSSAWTSYVAGTTSTDIFRHDHVTATTIRVSTAANGTSGANNLAQPDHSSMDGDNFVFTSAATNLVAGDTATQDVFLWNISGTIQRISESTAGIAGNGASSQATMSGDANLIAFQSSATNLIAGDTNGVSDIFLKNISGATTVRVGSVAGNGNSTHPWISRNGNAVAFVSSATNLVAGDTNGVADIFVADTTTGSLYRASVASDGTAANAASSEPVISANGRYVAFVSTASNLVANDTNGLADIFVHDTQTGNTVIISRSESGKNADAAASSPTISDDGRYVGFYSNATNLSIGSYGTAHLYRARVPSTD
jgi:hypothetical protein